MSAVIVFGLMGLGVVLIAIAAFWSWGKALEDSLGTGLAYLWQPFSIYYVITHWDKMRKPTFLGLAGVVLLLFSYILGRSYGILPP